MCERCVRKLKHLGIPKGKYGYIKALAHRFVQPFHFRITNNKGLYITGSVGLHWDRRIDIGVEAHMHKILQARTKRRYNRKRNGGMV